MRQSLRGYGLLEISQKPTLHFETLEIGAKKQLNGVIDKRINNVYFQYFLKIFFFFERNQKSVVAEGNLIPIVA